MTRQFDPVRHHRRSIRLRGYDYALPGVYFITICTHHRRRIFGDVVNGAMRVTDAGMVADTIWRAIPAHFPHVRLDAFVVMPDHVHGVIVITRPDVVTARATGSRSAPDVGATHASPLPTRALARSDHGDPSRARAPERPVGAPPRSVCAIVGSYKSAVSRRVNQLRDTPGAPVWQRDYYENIVRDDDALRRIRAYIQANPRRWVAPRGRS